MRPPTLPRPCRAAAVAGAAIVALWVAAAAEARAPALGLSDNPAFAEFRSAPRAIAVGRARAAGAGVIRFSLDWAVVAPGGERKPPGFDAEAPDEPDCVRTPPSRRCEGYNWGYVDEFVQAADRRGLRVMFTVVRAPRWAEGPDRPPEAAPGSWRPDPGELGAFVRAAARRYSGFYPDPFAGGDGLTTPAEPLPEVRLWQIWYEPNFADKLQPLYENGLPAAPRHYRRMLNAAAGALKDVSDENAVVTAGTGAVGGTGRIAPLAFWRDVMCIARSGAALPCPERPRFDVLAHHPVRSAPPSARGRGDDVRVPDLARLIRLVDRAREAGTVPGRRPKPLWITAGAWPTGPGRGGVSAGTQARYLTELVYRLSRLDRVPLFVWSGFRDLRSARIRSGLYFNRLNDIRRDQPKPALGAYRFPFVAVRARGGSFAWGMAPPGYRRPLRIERLTRRGWQTVALASPAAGREFTARVRGGSGTYRAVAGRARSLPWRR